MNEIESIYIVCVIFPLVLSRSASQEITAFGEPVERSQVVAVGTALPTATLPAGSHQSQVVVSI